MPRPYRPRTPVFSKMCFKWIFTVPAECRVPERYPCFEALLDKFQHLLFARGQSKPRLSLAMRAFPKRLSSIQVQPSATVSRHDRMALTSALLRTILSPRLSKI